MISTLIFLFWGSASWAQPAPPVATPSSAQSGVPPTGAAESPPPLTLPIVPPAAAPVVGPPSSDKSFLGLFPQLKNYVYEEPPSGLYLGAGLSPIGVIGSNMMFTADFFELHWIKDRYDIEIFDAAYGFTRAQSSEFESEHFIFKAVPKYRFFSVFSAGPIIGYELADFPNVSAKILRGAYEQPEWEPFSSQGWIYGGEVCETFSYGKYLIKIDESAFKETYSTTTTAQGWGFIFQDSSVNTDRSKIAAGTVLMITLNFLY